MGIEWILLHPAAPYAAIAAGLILCLALFLSLKRDLWQSEKRWRTKFQSFEADLIAKAEALNELSRVSALLIAPTPPRSGLNFTKRSQALQMIRRGESSREIAATLSLPQNEVDLLSKVQRMGLPSLNPAATRAAGL